MKIAVLGTSHWHAQMHMDAALSAGAEICCVWDENVDNAKAFAHAHGLTAVPSLSEALQNKPDLAVLMGHPQRVPAQALAVIDADVPMILEKPAVTRTSELNALRNLAKARGAFVGIPLPNRFSPALMEHARLAQDGRAGKLAHASFRLVNGPPQRYRDDSVGWLLDPAIGGGGALRNLGIHGIDTALTLAQGPLEIVSSSIGKRIHDEAVEDHALIVLRDAADTLFIIEAGYTYASMAPGGEFEWRLVTSNATLTDRGDSVSCATLDDATVRALPPEPTATRYRLFTADTLQRLRDGRPPAVTLEDYWAAMSLIDAAYAKANS
jgi:predicted dehydrogenase